MKFKKLKFKPTKALGTKVLRAFILGSIASVIYCPTCLFDPEQNNIRVIAYYCITFYIIWEFVNGAVKFINKKYNWIKSPNQRLLANLFFFIVVFIPLNYVYVKIIFWERPHIFNNYLIFDLNRTNVTIGFIVTLYLNTVDYFVAWKESIEANQKMEKQQLLTELKALKNQINPHFLFNNFNTLSQLINEDKLKAQSYLHQLSKVYRYLIENNNNLISIEKELEVLESYIYLIKTKHDEGLFIDIIHKELRGFKIPTFSLQMLVENALKHNTIGRSNPLAIKIYRMEGMLCIENNINPTKNHKIYSSGIGLTNIMERCKLLTGKICNNRR